MSPTASAPDSSAETDDKALGKKGRPTPSRAEREAANKRPLVADTKEARAAARAQANSARAKAREGMLNGDDRYLTARDKGPQRRFARDYVDSRWHLAEFAMPAMVVVILASLIPMQEVQFYSFLALWVFILIAIAGGIILSHSIKQAAAEKFGGKDRVEKGLGWYAFMRSVQMRFMRMPKPQVKRGAHRG